MAYNSIGDNNADGSGNKALLAAKMSTDILKIFMDTNVFKSMITNKTIENGKSESFPIVGLSEAVDFDNDGSELDLKNSKRTQRTIVIGPMTVAHEWITDMDKALIHYDSVAAQTESIGRALALKVDKDCIAVLTAAGKIKDAGTAASAGLLPFADDRYTSPVSLAWADRLSGAKIYSALHAAVTQYRSKDIVGSPSFVLNPEQYFALLNNAEASTQLTFVNDQYAQSGKVPTVLGIPVKYSPHFTAPANTAGSVFGLLFSKEAAGCLELMSVQTNIDRIPTRLAHLVVGQMAVGYGVLNHACAITIEVPAA